MWGREHRAEKLGTGVGELGGESGAVGGEGAGSQTNVEVTILSTPSIGRQARARPSAFCRISVSARLVQRVTAPCL